jgi:GT2 family glycosyltransferase
MNDCAARDAYERFSRILRQGKLPEALTGFQELLRSLPAADPLRVQIFFDLGELALEMNSIERAERLFLSAIFSDPFHALARRRLSEIYLPTLPKNALFSIVLPTYNRCRDLIQCIASLRRNSYFRLDIQVVCEPCDDGSLEYLATQQNSLDVNVTINPTRLGVPASINIGLSRSKGDYIFLINDDLEFTPGWDVFVARTLAAFPAAGCGAPLVLYPDGAIQSPGQYNTHRSRTHAWIGRIPYLDTAPATRRRIADFPALQIPRPCDYGYFPVFTRACWEKVGYIDDGYKRYYIDPDLGYRIQQAGYQTIYSPHSVLIHHELSHRDMAAVYEAARGDRQHFTEKWDLYK